MKSMKAIAKWILGAAMGAAFVAATPQQAKAQPVVGVEIGRPVAYPAAGLYAPARYDEWRRREFLEHRRWERERWERSHSHRGGDGRGWRDRRY